MTYLNRFVAAGAFTAIIAALALVTCRPAVAGTVYNVQFNSYGADYYEYGADDTQYAGPNELGVGGDVWNYVEVDFNSSLNGLVDSFGDPASNVDLGITNNGGYSGDVASYQSTATPTSISTLLSQYAEVFRSVTGTFTLSNLPDNASYDLVLYAANGYFNNAYTGFTVDGATALTSTVAQNGSATLGQTSFVAGGNYVEFTGTTSSTGQITGTYGGASGNNEGDWNGLTVELISAPETSTSVLFITIMALGFGGICWMSHRNRIRA